MVKWVQDQARNITSKSRSGSALKTAVRVSHSPGKSTEVRQVQGLSHWPAFTCWDLAGTSLMWKHANCAVGMSLFNVERANLSSVAIPWSYVFSQILSNFLTKGGSLVSPGQSPEEVINMVVLGTVGGIGVLQWNRSEKNSSALSGSM